MKTLGCLGIMTFCLFVTCFIPIVHILTIPLFLFSLVAFGIVAIVQLVTAIGGTKLR